MKKGQVHPGVAIAIVLVFMGIAAGVIYSLTNTPMSTGFEGGGFPSGGGKGAGKPSSDAKPGKDAKPSGETKPEGDGTKEGKEGSEKQTSKDDKTK